MDDLLIPAEKPIDVVYNVSRGDFGIKTHFHNSYEVIFVLEGKAQYFINGRKYTANKNSLVFINNMETHNLKVLEHPYSRYFILIKPDYFKTVIADPVLSSIFNNRPESFRHVIELDTDTAKNTDIIIKTLHEELTQKPDFWEAAVKLNLYSLFIKLYRNYRTYFPLHSLGKSMQIIIVIQKYLDEHYLEQISLEKVAKLHYMDMFYLSKLFRKITGFNFKEYLILLRITKAKDLLFRTDREITQVCIDSGFNNINHFIKLFKKIEGTTPLQYRKNCKAITTYP